MYFFIRVFLGSHTDCLQTSYSLEFTMGSEELIDTTRSKLNFSFSNSNSKPIWDCLRLRWLQILSWFLCLLFFLIFCYDVLQQYLRDDPITITEFIDISDVSKEIKIKICNDVFLDPRKILNYNGSQIDFGSYEFLVQALRGNDSFQDFDWHAFQTLAADKLILSSRIMQEFKLDLQEFAISCNIGHMESNCFHLFKPVIDDFRLCYEAVIDALSVGQANFAIGIFFYLDPEVNLRSYTSSFGLILVVSHPEEYTLAEENGIFLLPNELVTITTSPTHRIQTQSFHNAPCVDKKGYERYNFTGKPFVAAYDREICLQMCYSEVFYTHCNCAPFTTWNMTNTECVEQQEAWDCMWSLGRDEEKQREMMRCAPKCLPRCEKKFFNLKSRKKSMIPERSKQNDDRATEKFLRYNVE